MFLTCLICASAACLLSFIAITWSLVLTVTDGSPDVNLISTCRHYVNKFYVSRPRFPCRIVCCWFPYIFCPCLMLPFSCSDGRRHSGTHHPFCGNGNLVLNSTGENVTIAVRYEDVSPFIFWPIVVLSSRRDPLLSWWSHRTIFDFKKYLSQVSNDRFDVSNRDSTINCIFYQLIVLFLKNSLFCFHTF